MGVDVIERILLGRVVGPQMIRAKRWCYLYRQSGKLREMGLGGLQTVSLSEARQLAEAARKAKQAGLDPLPLKHEKALEAPKPTFGAVADDYIRAMRPQFRNAKHGA